MDLKVEIDKSPASLKALGYEINDNVYKNIDRYSVFLFDEENRYNKIEFSEKEQVKLVDKIVETRRNEKG